VKILTDDEQFGFIIRKTAAQKFFVFQIVLEGCIVGDEEPCILGTAMRQLMNLTSVSVQPNNGTDRFELVSHLRRDEIYDHTRFNVSESLDQWALHAYSYQQTATFLAQPNGFVGSPKSIIMAKISLDDYAQIAEQVVHFWKYSGPGF